MSFLEQHAAVFFWLALGMTAVCCGGGLTPAEQEAAAQQAMIDEDYQAALERYQGLLDRQGENGIPEDMRFRAALESIKCRAHLGRYDEAVDAFIQLEKSYEAEMAGRDGIRRTLDLTRILVREHAPVQTTNRLLDQACEHWPGKRARFEELKKGWGIHVQPSGRMTDRYEQPGEPRLIDIMDTPIEWELIDDL